MSTYECGKEAKGHPKVLEKSSQESIQNNGQGRAKNQANERLIMYSRKSL